jgi:D-xylonolactonase
MSSTSKTFETLATGYGLVEGPRVGTAGELYFSDARDGGVYCRTEDGAIETVVPKRRGVGGIAIHADGGLVVSGRNICHVRDGVTRIVFAGDDIPGFNDLFTDANGHILVGSQKYNPFADDARGVPGDLYRIHGEDQAEILYGDVGLTNGIGFSPDGGLMYHSDSARGHVILHDIADDGRCENRRVFVDMSDGAPDGLAVDEAGCVWVAAYGAGYATRFTPAGDVDTQLEVPAAAVASLCLGGADRRDLYVVTGDNTNDESLRGSIFRTRVDVAGLPAPLARV